MSRKIIYTALFLFCFGLMAESNTYNKTGRAEQVARPAPGKDKVRQESLSEELFENCSLHHFLIFVPEWGDN